MAAEHEGKDRDRRGDQPAALPPAGAHARPRHHPRRRLRPPLRNHHPCCESPCPTRAPCPSPPPRCSREAGYRIRRDTKELVVTDPDNEVEFFYLRPRDIAVYVGSGTVDCGDHRPRPAPRLRQRRDRGDAARLRRARPSGMPRGPGTCATRRRDRGPAGGDELPGPGREAPGRPRASRPQVVRLDGAVETAITLGVADVIADVVETGATLRSQGLEVFGEPILRSEAVLIRREGSQRDGRRSRCCAAGSPASSRPATT